MRWRSGPTWRPCRSVTGCCATPPPRPPEPTYDDAGHLVTVRIGDRASGVAAYADDWVGFRSIVVDPAYRRQGLALAVMDALLEWGAERGATTAYLQVLGDNAPAIALYAGLGFTTHHAYRYLAPRAAER